MSHQQAWRPLPVSAAGIPNLLISSTFTSQSYTVHVTDLANVWTETMDRKSLVRRGLEKDISIDLTDGADQIRRMLDYLRAAFDPGDPESQNTSLSLSVGDEGSESLVVQITCILPKVLNLKPLEWPMILKKSPQSAVASAVVLPLLRAHQRQTHDNETLISALQEKDNVITKLVDKLDATGTSLEHVFAALAGKRKITREVAEQRVKGLAPFNVSEFRAGRKDTEEAHSTDIAVLLDTVFGGEGLKSSVDMGMPVVPDGWWKRLGDGKIVTLVDRGKAKQRESLPPNREAEPTSNEEDDFQVQSSPPARNRRRGTPPNPVSPPPPPDNIETTDDESDDPDSQPTHPPQPTEEKYRIGAIGGKKQTAVPPPPRPSTPPLTSAKKPVQDDSETASDSDDDDKTSIHSAPSDTRLVGIGRIGGIGAIGGRPQQQAQPVAEASCPSGEESRGRTRKASEEHEETIPSSEETGKPTPRETSTERADRKRRELRQEQAARAAAGPVKKKRKF